MASKLSKRLEDLEDTILPAPRPTHPDGSPILTRADAEQLTDHEAIIEALIAYRSDMLLPWFGVDRVKAGFGWDDPDCHYYIAGTEEAGYYHCLAERAHAQVRGDRSVFVILGTAEMYR